MTANIFALALLLLKCRKHIEKGSLSVLANCLFLENMAVIAKREADKFQPNARTGRINMNE